MGTLKAVWRKGNRHEPMTPMSEVRVLIDGGLENSAKEAPHRQITVLTTEAWGDAEKLLGKSLDPVLRRANLLVAGVDLAETTGRVLRVGELRVEITGETTPCPQMDTVAPGLQAALKANWRGGAHGVALNDTTIRVGDHVAWEELDT